VGVSPGRLTRGLAPRNKPHPRPWSVPSCRGARVLPKQGACSWPRVGPGPRIHSISVCSQGHRLYRGLTSLFTGSSILSRSTTTLRPSRSSIYLGQRRPVRLSSSQDVSLIQRVLITLVLRRMINNGFSVDSSITCSESRANLVHLQCQYSRFLHSHHVCSQGHRLDCNQPRPCGLHAAATIYLC